VEEVRIKRYLTGIFLGESGIPGMIKIFTLGKNVMGEK
jgi:hypothetical protein